MKSANRSRTAASQAEALSAMAKAEPATNANQGAVGAV
jgi:hypothetical protein